ncbi:DUF2524 domain-containing protein [Paenibacillus sp. J5C_2022]|uniref:DUF2524 domain-containing protein n=1 Tax=Paenibacillus sp. J5C2022 TaxID=2977129 RepID=UPI0021CF3BD1|nr:DUF2524 domain-containing protein [Paenibacillus sp. J5C2022]MCU6709013.1 DUF2524 domain-containing protein [Paenibacillus sp. J5C2022]
MNQSLDSSYDCANASTDLPQLMARLELLQASGGQEQSAKDEINHLNNQIRFIQNKCDIPKET